jgi:hypothetical protein
VDVVVAAGTWEEKGFCEVAISKKKNSIKLK